MQDPHSFMQAVLHHWGALVSGVASFCLGCWEKIRKRQVNKIGLFSFSVIFIFVACYQAWEDEREENLDAQQRASNAETTSEYRQRRMDKLQETINKFVIGHGDEFGSKSIAIGDGAQAGVSNSAFVATMNVAGGAVGVNQGTLNSISDPGFKENYKILPDGRFEMASAVGGHATNSFFEINIAAQYGSNGNFFEATKHLSNALFLYEQSQSLLMSEGGVKMVNSELDSQYLADLRLHASQWAIFSQQYNTALEFADQVINPPPFEFCSSKKKSKAQCFRAMALSGLGRTNEVREAITNALLQDPKNPLAISLNDAINHSGN